MSLRLGDEAPDFTADTTDGTIDFHRWKGDSWTVLFSHPADYTPVCTTELGRTAALKGGFEERNTKVLALGRSHRGPSWVGPRHRRGDGIRVELPDHRRPGQEGVGAL